MVSSGGLKKAKGALPHFKTVGDANDGGGARHGDEADLVAAERADSFLQAGDMTGSAVWRRVLKAITERDLAFLSPGS